MTPSKIKTLAQLKKAGYSPKSIKTELRENLLKALKSKENLFEGIHGYDTTVLPDLKRAILSQHNLLFLGLRGQAKTRIARMLVHLLDEYVPVVAGSEINDDPLQPISVYAKDQIAELGDKTPISWLHRSDRYVEKLATPDVSIADLVGDVDPIKAATLKLPFSDERVIHFGLIPRSHRSIFVLNELPDLQARIQVSLFNILQEEDLQIRGFKLRLPLDIQFVFTANPEDYTNRGSIITPLKDRIESQILTHYPIQIEDSAKITLQEAKISPEQTKSIDASEDFVYLIETFVSKARESEYVDEKSGVSARLAISAYENLYSTAELRMILNNEKNTQVRIADLWGIIQSFTGKAELVYEGEQKGHHTLALELLNDAIKDDFHFLVEDFTKLKANRNFKIIHTYFEAGNAVDILMNASDKEYTKALKSVPGLEGLAKELAPDLTYLNYSMELILHGLSSIDIISKAIMVDKVAFGSDLGNLLSDLGDDINFN